ncbi:MAG TPA: energy transducer TonB [Coleofasciculaceae cyanobacterium]|jgi:TonB family protein
MKKRLAHVMALAMLLLSPGGFTNAQSIPQNEVEAYVTQVFGQMKERWIQAEAGKRPVRSQLSFTLNDDGTLSASRLETGPETVSANREALELLKQSAPFGVFPKPLKGSQMAFSFKFTPVSLEMTGHQVLQAKLQPEAESPLKFTPPALALMALSDTSRPTKPATSQPALRTGNEPGMEAYIAAIQQKVKEKWQLPQDYVFKCVVADIMVDRDGSLLSAMLKQSSGDRTVDKAALKAIQDAAPFERVPASAQSLPIQIEYIFDPVQSPSVE